MRKNVSILLTVVCILTFFTLVLSAEEKYDFRKTNWGMSVQQVKLAEKERITYRGDGEEGIEYELTYEVKLGLYDYDCYYYFVEDKLYKCEYQYIDMISDSSDFSAIKEYKRFKTALIEKYGKPFSQGEPKGYLGYDSFWNTSTTRIMLHCNTLTLFDILRITYESRELKEWADKILEEKTKIEF